MAKTKYNKKIKNGTEYYFTRIYHKNLKTPKDLYAKSTKELDEKIRKINKDLDLGILSTNISFNDFFTDWMFEVLFVNKKLSTQERYESIYRKYIKSSPLSKIKLKDLEAKDIQSYYNNLYRTGSTVPTINNLNKLLSPCIRYAYNTNKIIKDFSKAIVIPKESEEDKLNRKKSVIPFSLIEQKYFISAIKGDELEMLYLLALFTGPRQGELLALKWSDVDFHNKTININKTFKNIAVVTKNGRGKSKGITQTPKTVKGIRVIPLPQFLIPKLKEYKLHQNSQKMLMGTNYIDTDLIFTNKFGGHLDSSNIRKKLKKLLKTNNIPDRRFHDLRHTYATRLFELGEDPKVVQELLGHSNLSVTLDTYTHVLDSLKTKAINKLDLLYEDMGNL